MHLLRFLAIVVAIALAVFGGWALFRTEQPPIVDAHAPEPESPPATAGGSVAPVPPAPAALPVIDVPQRPVHIVPPDTGAPARAVTIKNRSGAATSAPQSRQVAATRSATIINGIAEVGGGISLTVGDRSIELFGVRPPQAADRCASAAQPPGNCREVARGALAARLKSNAAISCRVPPGQARTVPAALCIDATGVDLAGFLVGQGFALADPAQSYDYVGAENVARSLRRGLWRYR